MTREIDIAQLDAATRLALDAGYRLFQTHRLFRDDSDQVRYLLNALDLAHGACVLDAGCGIGEVSRLMSEIRPDLSFILANISKLQLSHCPTGSRFHLIHADCHGLPLAAATVDAVLFASALTQMDAPVALREAARVTKPGGVVLLFEMIRDGGSRDDFEAVTTARVHTFNELVRFAAEVGLVFDFGFVAAADDGHFRGMLRDLGQEHLLDPINPVIMRFIRG